MPSTFRDLAAALRETARIGRVAIAQLTVLGGSVDPDELAAMRERKDRLDEAAELLTVLAGQERLVRELARVGALIDFPTFSPRVDQVTLGSVVLMRGVVSNLYPGEAVVQIMLDAEQLTTHVVIGLGDVIGIEKPPLSPSPRGEKAASALAPGALIGP